MVVISSVFRRDGMVTEGQEAIANITAEAFKGSPLEVEYKKLSPTPDDFPRFVQRIISSSTQGADIRAEELAATKSPIFFNSR
ncbi:MAG: hypothetical protein JNK57_05875 [Planctomycetaceae bacterium]|nr:hypothetical protein [Planctomycetaceae bacterium]